MKRSHWPVDVSNTVLLDLCRQVIFDEWDGKCAFHDDKEEPCSGRLEWHHIKRRNIPHLKYSPTNGILLCQAHHKLSRYAIWAKRIEEKIGEDRTEWLDDMERKLFPDFLAERGQTRGEFLKSQKEYLVKLIQMGSKGTAKKV